MLKTRTCLSIGIWHYMLSLVQRSKPTVAAAPAALVEVVHNQALLARFELFWGTHFPNVHTARKSGKSP